MIFDPWSEENNNLINLINNNEFNILGPKSNKKKERFIIKLNVEKNNNNLILKSEFDKNTGLRYIYIKIYNDIGTIENISKSIIYSGSEYLMLSLQLLFLLNIKKVNLHDD